MDLSSIGDLLKNYAGSGDAGQFDEVAKNAPKDWLSSGLAEAFRSPQTPPFSQLLAQLFKQSNGEQRAGILNSIISTLGPTVVKSLAGGTLGGILATQAKVTPEQAQQVSPEEVERVATEAEQKDPTIIDRLSDFYADHPGLVKTLGGSALAVIMGKMAGRSSG